MKKTLPLEISEYIKLLLKWNKKFNLISTETEDNILKRHIADSAQLVSYINDTDHVLDIGSGAGFPGLVLSFFGIKNVILVERDQKKSAFLREASLLSKNNVEIYNCNVEDLRIGCVDVVTARACANLNMLLDLMHPFCKTDTVGIFLKGEKVREEIEISLENWNFVYELVGSTTSDTGQILFIRNLRKRV